MHLDAPGLNTLADKLLETAVLYLNQEAVVFVETENGLEVKEEYQDLRNRIYDILDEEINGEEL
jgi:hypothetical protein